MAGSIIKTFSLHSEYDKALIAKLDALKRGELSPLIRVALEEYFTARQGVTLVEIYQDVQVIKRALANVVIVNGAQTDQATDDDDTPNERLTDDELGGW